jgi:ketosteroid isomerase-like protein
MYRWTVARLVRFAYRRAIAGDDSFMMKMTSRDVAFNFPGESSFAASLVGRDALRKWLDRFVALEPDFEIRDVVVSGPPWDLAVAARFCDAIGDDYRNEGVEWIAVRWGRIRSVDVFLDTGRIEAWESRQQTLQGSSTHS